MKRVPYIALVPLLCITILCSLSAIRLVHAARLTVGYGQAYSSIQDAINNAQPGDTIEIYSNSSSNTYNESFSVSGLNDIRLIGMIPNKGITIEGTGIPEMDAATNVTLSDATGWRIENLTFRENDPSALFNFRISGGGQHTIINCQFSSDGAGVQQFHELFITESASVLVIQNIWNGTREFQKNHLSIQDPGASAIIKYNEFAGSNVYSSIFVGTTFSRASNCIIEHNYFHPSLDSEWLGIIYVRDTSDHSIRYNLISLSSPESITFGTAIVLRENATNSVIEHNTIILPTSGLDYESAIFIYWGPEQISNNIVRNNIFGGGAYSIFGADSSVECPSSVTYNYMYRPIIDFVDQSFSNFSNNTLTNTLPGFSEKGIVWRTNGTDVGTISEYYSLRGDAPALTAGENGTFAGAFGSYPPVILTASLMNGSLNNSYEVALEANRNGLTWTIESGALPPGLSLSGSGSITGTPTAAGDYNFTARAEDSIGQYDTKEYSITVDLTGSGNEARCLDSIQGTPVTLTTDNGEFVNLQGQYPSAFNPPSGYSFEYGLFKFRIINLPFAGASATVTFEFSGTIDNSGRWYWYNPSTGQWTDITNDANLIVNGNRVQITLTDNTPTIIGVGDSDNIPGQITDPSGPAMVPGSTGGGVVAGGGGGGGCFISTVADR